MLIVAAMAMTVMLAIPPHAQPRLSAADVAAAELKAVFGDSAVLCVQADEDGSSPAIPAPHVHDNCPLCQFHAQAMGLHAPLLAELPDAFAPRRLAPLGVAAEPPPPSRWLSSARPRGPPIYV